MSGLILPVMTLRDFGVGKTSTEEKVAAEVDERELFRAGKAAVGNLSQSYRMYDYDDPEFAEVQRLTNTVVSGKVL
ncbi:hypothetical protein MAR_030049 [Mya arenaria]|uniref:Uncharacterized protein n=1 Tax=Mya arenaria TaxID=6604 RepID=A0ABY7DJ52_MYAAR|nr:hypothetical protein MAR_030049 [Mya arenaria]